MMVLVNVEFDAAVFDKQVSYRLTQRLSVAGVFSSFDGSVTNDLSNGFGNVTLYFYFGFCQPAGLVVRGKLERAKAYLFCVLSLFDFSLRPLPLFKRGPRGPVPVSCNGLPIPEAGDPIGSTYQRAVSRFMPNSLLPMRPPTSVSFPGDLHTECR